MGGQGCCRQSFPRARQEEISPLASFLHSTWRRGRIDCCRRRSSSPARSCEKKRVMRSAGMETATASHRLRVNDSISPPPRFEQVRKPTSQAAKPRPAAKASPFSTSPRQAQRWAQAYPSQEARHAQLVTTRHSLLRQAQLQPPTGHDYRFDSVCRFGPVQIEV